VRRAIPLLGLWGLLATVLSLLTTSVRDWYVMTDELLYERLAISGSLLPRLRGELVPSLDHLYPLLLSVPFRAGSIARSLEQAHVLNAWVFASACIPAFLLARRVTGRDWAAYLVAFLSVCTPWAIFASFLLTEVVALPVFLWAMLAMQRAAVAPSAGNDVIALLALALAFFARTQFVLLVLVLPMALLAFHAGRLQGVPWARRARTAARAHRTLVAAYAAGGAVALVVALAGRLSSVLGVYRDMAHADLLPDGLGGSLAEHAAVLALGVGILPVVVGAAWLAANLLRPPRSVEAHAFACLGTLTALALWLEVTVYDLHLSIRFAHDRYLFYLAPLLFLGTVCALVDDRRPRWSLLPAAALVVAGFTVGGLPEVTWRQFETLLTDTPASSLLRPVVDAAGGLTAARGALAVATTALTALFVAGSRWLRPGSLTTLTAAFLLVCAPATTTYVHWRVLSAPSWSSRPLTGPPEGLFDWVDAAAGGESVAMLPYPVSSAYLVNQRLWRDYEFWNRSVVRDVHVPNRAFTYTGPTFPRIFLTTDPSTGAVSASPTRFVLHASQETRLRIAGRGVAEGAGVALTDAERPWRAEWLSSGLYPDGWTMPDAEARVRVFAVPGQRRAVTRTLTFGFRVYEDAAGRPVDVTTNADSWRGQATADTVRATVDLCVPARGFAESRVRAHGVSEIDGDARFLEPPGPRFGGVFVSEIALADEIGGPCRP
jgi:hypothetical protein